MTNLVAGAGLSGAIIANRIANELNEKVTVIDKRNTIAGNIFDYKDKETGILVHKYGPHIFHTNNKEIWDYLSKYKNGTISFCSLMPFLREKSAIFPLI